MDPSPKTKEIKPKINKWTAHLKLTQHCKSTVLNKNLFFKLKRKRNLIKLKSLCTAQETTDKTKRQPTEWVKLFANYMTDKGIISKIYKLNIKKYKQPHQKMGRRPE